MAFGIGDSLSIRVSADTADFTAGIESAQNRTDELAEELSALSRRASRAADSIEEAGDEATQATASFTALTAAVGSSGAASAFSALASRAGILTVAIVALSSALIPVVAAIGALAAIGGSFALVGFTGGILAATQRTETLKRQLRLTADTIIREFAPVTEEATRVIVALLSQFRPLIGELVPAEQQINAIGDAFQTIGENVIAAIPPLVDAATTLTTQFLPSVADSSDGLANFTKGIRDLVTSEGFENFISNIVAASKELAPELKAIVGLIGEFTDEDTIKGITTLVDGILDLVIVVGKLIDPLIEASTLLGSTFGGVGQADITAAGEVDSQRISDLTAEPGSQNPFAGANRGQTNVNVTVQGDTDVVRDVSSEVIEERERRSTRNTGGNTLP